MGLLEQKILILDCQTTGTRPGQDHLLELSWAWSSALDSFPPTEQSLLLKTPDELPSRVKEITGLSDQDMKLSLDPPEAWKKFNGAIESGGAGSFALAHYAQFERPFLQKFYADHQPEKNFPLPLLCSYRIAKRLFPEAPSSNIRGLAGYLGSELSEIRRSRDHVIATTLIWQRIASELHRIGINDLASLEQLLKAKPPSKSAAINFRVDRLKRLRLPTGPGIYRMLSKSGEILYVGKATSLRTRVNSYFRGGCSSDRRKLEMLARVWDIEVHELASPLEAALQENEEIKKHAPYYNRALKPKAGNLTFFSNDFSSASVVQDSEHPLGPFRDKSALHQIVEFTGGLESGILSSVFFDLVSDEALKTGFTLFCEEENISQPVPRRLLCWGLKAIRMLALEEEPEETEGEAEDEAKEISEPAEVALKLRHLFIRAAEEYLRSKKLSRLLNAVVSWEVSEGNWRVLRILRGAVAYNKDGPAGGPAGKFPWAGLQLADYDRMSVLQSELRKRPHRIEPEPVL